MLSNIRGLTKFVTPIYPVERRWNHISVDKRPTAPKWHSNSRTGWDRDLVPEYQPCFVQKRQLSYQSPPSHTSTSDKDGDVISEIDQRLWQSEARYNQPHPIWSDYEVKAVKYTHHDPRGVGDIVALTMIKTLRTAFDIFSGYKFFDLSAAGWIHRIIVLETVAGVPGLVGAGFRHLRSLRKLRPDYGWIHTLLEEAENERMHLMVALTIKKPGVLYRAVIVGGQLFFFPLFTLIYGLSPKTAHRFVGYLEEEAVKTYSTLLEELQSDRLSDLASMRAPKIGRAYWQLKDDASFRDLIYAIRADESHHRDVNHTFAGMRADDENPFAPGH